MPPNLTSDVLITQAWMGNMFHYSNSNLHTLSQVVFCKKAALYYPPLNLC